MVPVVVDVVVGGGDVFFDNLNDHVAKNYSSNKLGQPLQNDPCDQPVSRKAPKKI